MPLDKLRGESIGDLGHQFHVAHPSKWRETPFFETAARHAEEVFLKRGALWPMTFEEEEVTIQEYYAANKLAFVFFKRIAGKDYYSPYVFDLPPELVAELVNTGRWEKNRTH